MRLVEEREILGEAVLRTNNVVNLPASVSEHLGGVVPGKTIFSFLAGPRCSIIIVKKDEEVRR